MKKLFWEIVSIVSRDDSYLVQYYMDNGLVIPHRDKPYTIKRTLVARSGSRIELGDPK